MDIDTASRRVGVMTNRLCLAVCSLILISSCSIVLLMTLRSYTFVQFSLQTIKTSLPAIHVDINTHNLSQQRLRLGEMTFRQSKYFKSKAISTLAIVPENFSFVSDTPMLKTKCRGKKAGSSDFVCKVQAGQDNFLDRYPNKNWFVRAIDDTWIDDENLMKYVSQLETFIDPKKNIVAKAARDVCYESSPFIHGGAGWLVSRALLQFLRDSNQTLPKLTFLAYNHQDDTAMSVVLWKLFPKLNYWDDMHFVSPLHLNMHSDTDDFTNYTHLKKCSKKCRLVKAKDIAVLHLHSWSVHPTNFGKAIRSIPENVYLCRLENQMHFCNISESSVQADSFDLEFLKSTTPIITAADYHPTFIDAEDIKKIRVLKGQAREGQTIIEMPKCNLLRDPLDPSYHFGDRILWNQTLNRFVNVANETK